MYGWGIVLSAQTAEDAAGRQQSALAAMQESLARQRAAIQQQFGRRDTGEFFVLPPPARMAVLTAPPEHSECEPLAGLERDSLVSQAAQHEGLDPALLTSVIRQESDFVPCAVSAKGAMGLMQLMPATAAELGVTDAFDPQENIGAGARLLKELLRRYGGDVFKALSAYNAGPARVDAVGGIPQIPETLDYINRILSPLPAIQ
jgi:soluble lytic murein transglycosylase-like protein